MEEQSRILDHRDLQNEVEVNFVTNKDNELERILDQKEKQINLLRKKINKIEKNYNYIDKEYKKDSIDFEFNIEGRVYFIT